MDTRTIGRTGLAVTEVGFGGGPIGGLFQAVSSEDAQAALAAGWEAGIRYYDVAPHYGLGRAEREFGTFLQGRPRDEFVLSTKVGRVLEPQEPAGDDLENLFAVPADHRRIWDFSRDGVRRSVEDSLTRMGLDRVDVLLLHDAEEHFDEALRQGYPALEELRAEGVVTAIGSGMGDAELLARLVRETDVDVVMMAGRVTRSTSRRSTTCCRSAPSGASRCSRPPRSTPACSPAPGRARTRRTATAEFPGTCSSVLAASPTSARRTA